MHPGYHGGLCCGMKVIRNLGCNPDYSVAALLSMYENEEELEDLLADTPDVCGRDVESSDSFFFDAAPSEKAYERLDRYLSYLREHRPYGIVEITLADDPDAPGYPYSQTPKWRPVLEARGFREVNNCLNSNSGNRVYVFHLNME